MRRRALKTLHLGIVFVLVASLALSGGSAMSAPKVKTGLQIGDLAPDFTLKTLDGKTLTRDGLKGKVVLLDFWATWCGPCRQALPELKDLHQKNLQEPVVIISVSVDDRVKTVEAFVRDNDMSWPQAWDRYMRVTGGVFRVDTFPSYVVLDADGRITYKQKGWSPGRSAVLLDEAVSKALAISKRYPAPGDVAARP